MVLDLWMSAESLDTVGKSYQAIANRIEALVNEKLRGIPIDQADQWTFIAIIFPQEMLKFYPETVSFRRTRRAFECRTSIDYEAFLNSDTVVRIELVADALKKNVHAMERMKVSLEDRERIIMAISESADLLKSSMSSKH